jgi:hypothetical protein
VVVVAVDITHHQFLTTVQQAVLVLSLFLTLHQRNELQAAQSHHTAQAQV